MVFKTTGNKSNSVILFFHAMGVTGESSMPVAEKNGRKILLHYANIDCVLLRTEVSKQKR